MNVDTMRKIDYFAGVPLCFLATLLEKLVFLFTPRRRKKPENVLFIELSEMGSALIVDPAMRKLQSRITGKLYFVIFHKNKVSLQLLKTVDDNNIFTIDEHGFLSLTLSTIRFFFWCRSRKIDSVIDLELFSRFTALLSFLCGAVQRVGFHSFHNEGLYRGNFLTHKVAYNPHQHMAKNFMALTDALLSSSPELPYLKRAIADEEIKLVKAVIAEDEKKEIRRIIGMRYQGFDPALNPIILVNSNASDLLPQRRWRRDNYCEVIKKICACNNKVLVLLTGAPEEFTGTSQLAAQVGNKRCLDFAGAVSFLQLPALYSISEFMLTNDSGPAHFAAITGMHTMVIFGPETPALYGSLGSTTPIYAGFSCSPCVSAANHRKTPCLDNKCLQAITPDMVFSVIKPHLDALNR
jgi:ADP-heptose:LPS heptosyltransferase